MKSLKFEPGAGTSITALTTTSQASGELPAGDTYLVRVVGVAAFVRSGTNTPTATTSDLYLADGDSIVMDMAGTSHDEIAAIAAAGSGGTVYIYPVSLVEGD